MDGSRVYVHSFLVRMLYFPALGFINILIFLSILGFYINANKSALKCFGVSFASVLAVLL